MRIRIIIYVVLMERVFQHNGDYYGRKDGSLQPDKQRNIFS